MQAAYDVLTTAIESRAISYWADVVMVARNKEHYVTSIELKGQDEPEEEWREIGPMQIDDAAKRILKENLVRRDIAGQFLGWPDADRIDVDAEGADCVVQLAAFGEIIYG